MLPEDILREYLSDEAEIVGRMIDRGFASMAAKSAGYEGRRPGGFVDQSMLVHVLNGVFAITRLVTYLQREGVYELDETSFRRALALYTTHDLHKVSDLDKGNRGEFDLPLAAVDKEMRALGIAGFASTTPEEHRLAMVHTQSPKVADYQGAATGTSAIIGLVRLADALASMTNARDYTTAQNYLKGLSWQVASGGYRFFFHEVDDYRGLSTLLVHKAVADVLWEALRLFPLLFFPNGVLYVGKNPDPGVDVGELRERVTRRFFGAVRGSAGGEAANAALNPAQTVKFETYAYLFAGLGDMLDVLYDYALRRQEKRFLSNRLQRRAERQATRRGRTSVMTASDELSRFDRDYGVAATADEDADFSQKWSALTKYVEGLASVAGDVLGEREWLSWLLQLFAPDIPAGLGEVIIRDISNLTSGGVADHCVVLAYHYLRNHRFGPDEREAGMVELGEILRELRARALASLESAVDSDGLLELANRELGLEQDVADYLRSNLVLSPLGSRRPEPEGDAEVLLREHRRQHNRLCVICNRPIPAHLDKKNIGVKSAIFEGNRQVFSNRLIPRASSVSEMVWCPMCYLEFMLRKLLGVGFTTGVDANASDRLFLFLLPDYSFTPEALNHARELFAYFDGVTRLKLRQRDDEPGAPSAWLLGSGLDRAWVGEVRAMFAREAENLNSDVSKGGVPTGRRFRDLPGEKIVGPRVEGLNYQMLVYEKSVGSGSRAKRLAPTRTELWAKALYAGCLLQTLLGVRVYITDKPYLPISQPTEMKAIIHLDAPHNSLRAVLDGTDSTVSLAQVPRTIGLLSAVWEVNTALTAGADGRSMNVDKQVANVLEVINSEPLAGARFYKERVRDGRPLYPAFEAACRLLLEELGGNKMNLAQELAGASLDLYIPSLRGVKAGRGAAHRFETLFRTAIEALKKDPKAPDEELVHRVAGALVKRVQRLDNGVRPLHGEELLDGAERMARLIVTDLFSERCGGSLARLAQEENSIADAVFFVTSRELSARWSAWKTGRADRASAVAEGEV